MLVALLAFPPSKALVRRIGLILIGNLVDVGGYRLRIDCKGSGNPVVILDSGLTFTRHSWDQVGPQLSQFTRVCTYDRAGLGDSDSPSKFPRTSQQIVRELETLLVNARIVGPYVLVGHSFGGFNVRLYASQHPDQVAGIVLIDPSHEDQFEYFASLLPPQEWEAYIRENRGDNIEHVDVVSSAREIRVAPPLPTMPLVVLSAGLGDENLADVVNEMHTNLARLTPSGKRIVVTTSGHFIQNDQPDFVISAIRMVVEEARLKSPFLVRTTTERTIPFEVNLVLGGAVSSCLAAILIWYRKRHK